MLEKAQGVLSALKYWVLLGAERVSWSARWGVVERVKGARWQNRRTVLWNSESQSDVCGVSLVLWNCLHKKLDVSGVSVRSMQPGDVGGVSPARSRCIVGLTARTTWDSCTVDWSARSLDR